MNVYQINIDDQIRVNLQGTEPSQTYYTAMIYFSDVLIACVVVESTKSLCRVLYSAIDTEVRNYIDCYISQKTMIKTLSTLKKIIRKAEGKNNYYRSLISVVTKG